MFFRRTMLLLAILLLGKAGWAEPENTTNKVLFVGNSFSFFNNGLHSHTANLVKASGEWQAGKNRYRLLTLSGAKLSEHRDILKGYLSSTENVWDIVVLQGHSAEPLEPEEKTGFRKSAGDLVAEVRASGAKPLLFMTWAYGNQAEMIGGLSKAYRGLGASLDAPVVPVGEAFDKARTVMPDVDLYVDDVRGVKDGHIVYRKARKHPSRSGTYLAACVFYAVLTGNSPVGNIYRAGLPEETAFKLQQIAFATVREFGN